MKPIVLLVVSVAGMYICAYFIFVYYGAVPVMSRLLPAFCRPGERTCRSIAGHPAARLFGIPNVVPGILYYGIVLVCVFDEPMPVVASLVLCASWVTVGLALYLVYTLVCVLKVPCLLCFAAHGINLCIAILLTFG